MLEFRRFLDILSWNIGITCFLSFQKQFSPALALEDKEGAGALLVPQSCYLPFLPNGQRQILDKKKIYQEFTLYH